MLETFNVPDKDDLEALYDLPSARDRVPFGIIDLVMKIDADATPPSSLICNASLPDGDTTPQEDTYPPFTPESTDSSLESLI
jgi:hypothetical protein